jgi:hypothetical protein
MDSPKDIVIFDLDGCLFDDEHRKNLIDLNLIGDARYADYHERLDLDLLLPDAEEMIKKSVDQNLMVVFLTARPIKYSLKTTHKIGRHFSRLLGGSVPIYMRGDNDARSAVEFKREKVREIIAKGRNEGRLVVAAFDDRQDIVSMYLEEDVPAWILDKDGTQAPGNFRESRFCHEQRGNLKRPIDDGPVQPRFETPPNRKPDAGDLMATMARTFKERNAVYGNNAEVVGRVMAALFPHGVKLKTPKDFELWHLLELVIVKLTRFTQSDLTHEDSIHDLAIYAAMVELLVKDHNIEVVKP